MPDTCNQATAYFAAATALRSVDPDARRQSIHGLLVLAFGVPGALQRQAAITLEEWGASVGLLIERAEPVPAAMPQLWCA